MKITQEKEVYCHTCALELHYLGVASHRAAHRRREEDCEITYTNGDTFRHKFSRNKSE